MQPRCMSKLSHRSFCKPSMQRLTCYNPRSYNHCGYRPLSQRMAGHVPKESFCPKAKTKTSVKLPFAFCKFRQFSCTSKELGHRRLAIHDFRYLLINPWRKLFSQGANIEISSSLTTGQSEIVVWNEVCRRPTTGFASCACVIAVCENVY